MTKKQQLIAECMIQHPTALDKEIAEMTGITPANVCIAKKKPEFQEYLQKRLKETWKDSIKIAQKTMIDLAKDGDRQAAQFILESNGYKSPEEINVNEKVIRVTIKDDED